MNLSKKLDSFFSKGKNKQSEFLFILQKRTGLDCYFFLRSSFWITIRQVFGGLSGFLITLAFVHLGSKQLFGQYNLLLSLFGIVGILSLPDFNVALIESVSKGFDSSLKKAFKIRFFWSLMGIFLALIMGVQYLTKDRIIGITLLLISFFTPLFYSPAIYTSFLAAKKKFKTLSKFQSITSVATAFYFVMALFLTKNIIFIFFFYVLLTSALNLYFYIFSQKFIENKQDDPKIIPYGYFLSGLNVISRLVSHLDKILLSSFLGLESLAIYSVATKIPGMVGEQLLAFFSPPSIKIAHFSERKSILAIKDHFLKLLLGGIFLSLVTWLTLPMVIKLLFTKEYYSSIFYAKILSLGLIFGPTNLLFSNFLMLQKKQKLTLFTNVIFPIFQILLYFVLLPLWGIYGLVTIKVIQQFLFFLISIAIIFFAN